MERYAPNAKDLAGRDVVARSMVLEILDGKGCGPNGDYVYLKLDHLGEEVLESRLPGICELSRTFAHVDPVKEPVPVVPTCHYMMGGVPTNVDGQALTIDDNGNDTVIPGLYACGEVACVSVHGANRLGGNSLLDLVVFGRASGLHIEKSLREGIDLGDTSDSDIEQAMSRLDKLNNSTGGENVADLRAELQDTMQKHFGVFRNFLTRAWPTIQPVSRRWNCTTCSRWLKRLRSRRRSARRAAAPTPGRTSTPVMMKIGCAILFIFPLTREWGSAR
jgi:succinate dehydrogenase / fumarate reductase flavoprotein subunit